MMTHIDEEYRRNLLTTARDGRVREITEYQVNIDNFSMAIAEIGGEPDLAEFKKQLSELLASSVIEQRKSMIILGVIERQLGGL